MTDFAATFPSASAIARSVGRVGPLVDIVANCDIQCV
jgi:hypothetical protein